MSTNKNNNPSIIDDVHPFLEKMLIETYLNGNGNPTTPFSRNELHHE